MNNLFYLRKPTPITGSDFVISALAKDGSPHGLRRREFRGDEIHDISNSIPLIPLFTRMAENGDDPPDFRDLRGAQQEAAKKGEVIYGEGFFLPVLN
jgi:hypothetical protein